MRKLVMRAALLLALVGAAAVQAADRRTCLAAMAAYPKIYEAVSAGQPQERVVAIIMAEGQRAGIDRVKLATNASRWVEMLYDVPPQLLPTPEWVRQQRGGTCAGYTQ